MSEGAGVPLQCLCSQCSNLIAGKLVVPPFPLSSTLEKSLFFKMTSSNEFNTAHEYVAAFNKCVFHHLFVHFAKFAPFRTVGLWHEQSGAETVKIAAWKCPLFIEQRNIVIMLIVSGKISFFYVKVSSAQIGMISKAVSQQHRAHVVANICDGS